MKRKLLLVISLILTISLCGCGLVPSVELTESEQKVIAEYAAGLLLKYDKNYSGSILKVEEEIEEEPQLPVVEEPDTVVDTEESQDIPAGEYPETEFDEDLVADNAGEADEESVYSDKSIAEAIGIEGFDIIYKSYQVCSIYPPEESEDLVFSLEAAPGMELLILQFGITNDMPDRAVCNVLDTEAGFRLVINGSERIQYQKTMLLNDLSSYSEEVEGYGMSDAVLVFEISEGTSSSISSLDLIVKKDNEYTTHRLR